MQRTPGEELDEELAQTFPASDPPSILEPGPADGPEAGSHEHFPVWSVAASWSEDEADVSESWLVSAASAEQALALVRPHLRFPPHDIRIYRTGASAAAPGQVNRSTV